MHLRIYVYTRSTLNFIHCMHAVRYRLVLLLQVGLTVCCRNWYVAKLLCLHLSVKACGLATVVIATARPLIISPCLPSLSARQKTSESYGHSVSPCTLHTMAVPDTTKNCSHPDSLFSPAGPPVFYIYMGGNDDYHTVRGVQGEREREREYMLLLHFPLPALPVH